MWVHAYQSHVWNCVASARVRLFGPQAVPGDLVLPANSSVPGDVAEPSPTPGGVKASGVEVGTPGVEAVGGGDPEELTEGRLDTAGKDEGRALPDATGSPNRGGQRVEVLTKAAIDEAAALGVTPRDLLRRVVLPLPGTSISYPSHEVSTAWACLNPFSEVLSRFSGTGFLVCF